MIACCHWNRERAGRLVSQRDGRAVRQSIAVAHVAIGPYQTAPGSGGDQFITRSERPYHALMELFIKGSLHLLDVGHLRGARDTSNRGRAL